MRMAREASTMSKDPSTQVGAVIVDKDRRVVGTGFNGFPRLVSDNWRLGDRDEKLQIIIHAEMNALLDAGVRARGGRLYLYGFRSLPCRNCMKHLIQMDVTTFISCGPPLPDRWLSSVNKSQELMREVGGSYWVITNESLEDLDGI